MTLRRKLLVQFFTLAVLPIAVFASINTVTALRSARASTEERVRRAVRALSASMTKALESELFYLTTLVEEAHNHGMRAAAIDAPETRELLRWVSYYRLPALTPEPLPRPSRVCILERGNARALTLEAPSPFDAMAERATPRAVVAMPSPYARLVDAAAHGRFQRFLTGTDARGPVVIVTATLPVPGGSPARGIAIEFALLELFERITAQLELLVLDDVFVAHAADDSGAYRVVCHDDPSYIGTPLASTAFPLDALQARLQAPDDDALPLAATARGSRVHGARLHPGSGLLLGASAAVAPSFAPLRRGVLMTWLFFGLAAIVVTLGILGATRGISDAVETIAHGTRAIAAGKFEHPMPVRRADEFGDIAKRINDMSHELLLTAESRAIARISARLVHDLKGVVSQMNLLLYNLKTNYDDAEFRSEFFGFMEDLVAQVETITRQMRRSEPPVPQMVDVDLNALVRDALDTPLVRSHLDLHVQPELDARGSVRTDPALLADAVHDVLSNAVEAMEGRGTLRVRTGSADGCRQFVEIEDEGPGMTRAFVDNELFRPFATTKTNGSGLGMYGVRQVVRSLGGRVHVDSEEQRGTRVRIEIGEQASP